MRINNVIHFSTEDFGGAGSAALRVHKTCQEYGFNSILFCKNKRTSEESILAVRSILKNFYFRVLNKIDSKGFLRRPFSEFMRLACLWYQLTTELALKLSISAGLRLKLSLNISFVCSPSFATQEAASLSVPASLNGIF